MNLTNQQNSKNNVEFSQVLALQLIQADLRYHRLLFGLIGAGLSIDNFPSELSLPIFQIIGFLPELSDSFELFEFYYHEKQKLMQVDLEEFFPKLPDYSKAILANLYKFSI